MMLSPSNLFGVIFCFSFLRWCQCFSSLTLSPSSSSSSSTSTLLSNTNAKLQRARYNFFELQGSASSPMEQLPSKLPPNEFSRPLQTDRILKTASGKQRRSYRQYETTIEATEEECTELAKRFELKAISKLQADLSLTNSGSGTISSSLLVVRVEGSILASLTQTCVRTREDIDVTVEFPITAIVKPMSVLPSSSIESLEDTLSGPKIQKDAWEKNDTKNRKTKRNQNKQLRKNRSMDMMELQSLIEQQESEMNYGSGDDDDDDNEDGSMSMGGSTEEEIIEDEAIYSARTGTLDVGELVAQTFWLNLDPYPKKPGSGPMEFTISG